jgi:hypothetical protein
LGVHKGCQFNTGWFDNSDQWVMERKDVNYFHFTVFEYVNSERHVKFKILASTPHIFLVRMPEFDYVKSEVKACVEYDLDQLLCFLLAYDKKQCHEFMKQLYRHSGVDDEKIVKKFSEIPIFEEFYGEKEI